MSHTILVVEDNPITRKMMRFTLESEGYVVLEAHDGQTALQLASQRPPDMVVQDYVLPDMDGLHLLSRLRALPGAAEIPVLVVTGMVSRLDELKAAAGPNTTLMPKPIEPSRLVEIVGVHLGVASSRPLGAGRRVLVVDDEPLNRKLATLRLRDAGFEVETAADGLEGLRKARESIPDVILSDVMMPGMDGFLFCKAVRDDPKVARVPVVLLSSSYVEEADRALAMAMGAHGLLLREPDFRSAISALMNALEGAIPLPGKVADADLDALHKERIQLQLEAQLARNETLLRQGAIQAAALSVVRGLASALARPDDLAGILGDVLVHCLDATGLSTGILYLVGRDGDLQLKAQAGLPSDARQDAAGCFGLADGLRRVLEAGDPVALVRGQVAAGGIGVIASRLEKNSALIIPFVVGEERIGLLVLAADTHDLSDPAWSGFARALASQFGQTIAVGRSLAKGAASEARYSSLMEQANDAILLMDPGRQILEVNRQAETLLGRPREELIGRQYVEFVAAEERSDAERRNDQLLGQGSDRVQNRHFQRPDGTRVAVDVSASLVRIGEETLALAILRDVTERNRAEAALQEAQHRLQHVVSSSPAVLFSLRPEGQKFVATWISENVERLLGYRPEEVLLPDWWVSHLHPEERERVLGELAALFTEGYMVQEYRFLDRAGAYRWLRGELRLLRDDAGTPVEAVGSWTDVSARKEAETALQESERRFSGVLSNLHLVALMLDTRARILYCNDYLLDLTGWRAEEVLGRSWFDLFVPPEIDDLGGVFAALLADRQEAWHHENEILTRSGGRRLIRWNNSVLRSGSGEVIGTASIGEDITEQKRAEAALRESEKRMRDLVVANPAVIFALRVEQGGRLTPTWVSENVERLLGYTAQEVRNPDWWPSHVHPEDRGRVHDFILSMLSETDQWTQEYRFLHKDGGYRWLRDEERVLRDAAGTTEIVGSLSDVSDRKAAEEMLDQSEQQYRMLFDSNPHPMWVYDERTLEFLAVNAAAIRIYGYTLEEFLQMTIRQIRPPEEIPALEERLRQKDQTRGPSPATLTWTHKKKDGTPMQVEVTSTRISFAGRSARLTLVNDVTEKKALGLQLVQAQKMESVGRLAGGVAHDFNNLLGVITGYGELLRRRLEEPRLRKYSEDILQAADRAAGLTRQLLAFSRRQVLQPRVLDLNGIVGEVEKMLRRLIGEDVGLKTVLARNIGLVRADRGQIEQVLMNLAVNARDAMPKGGKITIETARVELDEAYARKHEGVAPGRYVMLAVSDTGHGMTPEVKSRIFEPFFTTKGEGKGTGLGLATVYGIVKQSGGHVFVYSEPGTGSSFKVYLPLIGSGAAAETPPVDQAAPLPRGGETILLVEDEVSLRELVRECLEDCGYTVLDARHGADALERAAGHKGPIHLLMTDVVMPGIGGRDLAERLAPIHPEIRVVYMSGYTDDSVVHHGVLSEEMDFLQKPFTQDALARKVRVVLDRKGGGPQR